MARLVIEIELGPNTNGNDIANIVRKEIVNPFTISTLCVAKLANYKNEHVFKNHNGMVVGTWKVR